MSFYQNLKTSEDRLVAYRTRWYALHEEHYKDETLPSTLYRMSPAVTRRSIIVNWLWVAWTAFLLPMSLFDIGEHPEATVITSGLVVAFISAAVFTRRFPNLQAVGESPVMSTPKAVVIWTAVKLGIVFGLLTVLVASLFNAPWAMPFAVIFTALFLALEGFHLRTVFLGHKAVNELVAMGLKYTAVASILIPTLSDLDIVKVSVENGQYLEEYEAKKWLSDYGFVLADIPGNILIALVNGYWGQRANWSNFGFWDGDFETRVSYSGDKRPIRLVTVKKPDASDESTAGVRLLETQDSGRSADIRTILLEGVGLEVSTGELYYIPLDEFHKSVEQRKVAAA